MVYGGGVVSSVLTSPATRLGSMDRRDTEKQDGRGRGLGGVEHCWDGGWPLQRSVGEPCRVVVRLELEYTRDDAPSFRGFHGPAPNNTNVITISPTRLPINTASARRVPMYPTGLAMYIVLNHRVADAPCDGLERSMLHSGLACVGMPFPGSRKLVISNIGTFPNDVLYLAPAPQFSRGHCTPSARHRADTERRAPEQQILY